MPATPDFTDIVPGPWDLDKLVELIKINRDAVTVNKHPMTGELILAIGYSERDDGNLVRIR